MKETAGVLQNAKPHPRPDDTKVLEERVRNTKAIEAVARSSS
jgi:hypothetical protein